MKCFSFLFAGLLAVSICVGLSGCNSGDKDKDKDKDTDNHEHMDDDDDSNGDDDAAKLEAKIKDGLAMLSEEDRELAEKQITCLVMEKSPLGKMGKPIRVTNGDKVGFLCCADCQKAFDDDPDKFLAKE